MTDRKGKIMLKRAEDVQNFWAYDFNIKKDSDLTLLDNAQFIYELSLAELELGALGAEFEVTNGLREFKIRNRTKELDKQILHRAAYFKTVGELYTDYFQLIQKNRTRSVNQYLTHWIYPYKGKFHPQMIRALMNIIGLKKGDTVFEPFSGSGTAALEAQLMGINCIGIDISPLCILLGNVKTQSYRYIEEIEKLKDLVIENLSPSIFNGGKTKDIFESMQNDVVKDFYIVAKLLTISDNARRGRKFEQAFVKNLNRMIDSTRDFKEIVEEIPLDLGKIEMKLGDSRKVELPDNSIDGIITSPPYSIALDYVENDAHSLEELGSDLTKIREEFIGVRGNGQNRVTLYNNDMRASYAEMYRVLKPGRFAVIVVGNATYQGKEVKTVEFTINFMDDMGFELVKNVHKLIFGLYNIMKSENILIFKKSN